VANIPQLPQTSKQSLNEATEETAHVERRRPLTRKTIPKQDKILVEQVTHNRDAQPSVKQLELVQQESLIHEFEDLLLSQKRKSVYQYSDDVPY
jgi:hypothetical protein